MAKAPALLNWLEGIPELDELPKKSKFGWFSDEIERGGLETAIEYRMLEYASNSLRL